MSKCLDFENFLNFFDVYGSSFTPTVGSKSSHKSVLGGVLGIFFLYCATYYSVIYLKSMFGRDSPNVYIETVVDYETKFNLDIAFSYTIEYKLRDQYRNGLTDSQIEERENFIRDNQERLFTNQIIYQSKVKDVVTNRTIGLRNCNPNMFGTLKELEFKQVKASQCLNISESDAITIYQNNKTPNGKTLFMNVYKCANYTGFDKCFSESVMVDYLTQYEFSIFIRYGGLAFRPSNYSFPFENFYGQIFFRMMPLQNSVVKKFNLQAFNVISDINIVMDNEDDYERKTKQQIKDHSYYIWDDIMEKGFIDSVERKLVLKMILECSPEVINAKRSYPKIPDICSNVMGTVGILSYVFCLFLQAIYDSKTSEIVLHQIFNVNEDLIDKIIQRRKLREKGENLSGKTNGEQIEVDSNIPKDVGSGGKKDQENNVHNENFEAKIEIGTSLNSFRKQDHVDEKENNNYDLQKVEEIRREGFRDPEPLLTDSNTPIKEENINKNLFSDFSRPEYETEEKKLSKRQVMTRAKTNFELMRVDEENSIALQNISDSKKRKDPPTKHNYTMTGEDKTLLNLWDHFAIVFCNCCLIGRTRKIAEFYKELNPYIEEYLDMLNIVNNMQEVNKLKFLLLEKDQIALFNLRNKVQLSEDPAPKTDLTKSFYFINELNDDVDLEKIRETLKSKDKSLMNEKLLSLSQ